MICSFFQVHCTCLHFLCWSRTNKIKISLVRKTLDNIEVWALGVKYQIIGFDISWWTNNWECKNIVTNFVPLLVVEFFFHLFLSLSLSLLLFVSRLISFSLSSFRCSQDAMPCQLLQFSISPDHFQRLTTINIQQCMEHLQRIAQIKLFEPQICFVSR